MTTTDQNPAKLDGWTTTLLLFAIMVCCFAAWVGFWQFGGYDLSPLIDLQYRLSRGEEPGLHFVSTLPYSFVAWVDAWSVFFEPSWAGLIGANLFLYLASTLLVLRYWPNEFGVLKKAVIVALLAVPTLFTGHLWHSSMSQMIALAYCVLTIRFLLNQRRTEPWGLRACLSLITGILFFSKQNLGLPLIGATTLLLLASRGHSVERKTIYEFLVIQATGIASIGVVYGALVASPQAILDSFLFVRYRASLPREMFDALGFRPTEVLLLALLTLGFYGMKRQAVVSKKWVMRIAIFAVSLMLVAALRRIGLFAHGIGHYDALLRVAVIMVWATWLLTPRAATQAADSLPTVFLFGVLVVAVLPLLSDWDSKFNNIPLVLAPMILLTPLSGSRQRLMVIAATALVLTAASAGGWVRQRMHDVGPGAFWQPGPLRVVNEGYFAGLHAGPLFHDVRREARLALNEAGRQRAFCGPRIEFCYADNGLQSPVGMPLWWHPGSSYPLTIENDLIELFKSSQFTLLLFLRNDRTRVPKAISEYIDAEYIRQPEFVTLDVYRKR
jgi:hypothetical protein